MAVPRDPTSSEIAQFLATRSSNQMLRIVSEVRAPLAALHLTEAMLQMPPVVVAESAPPEKAKKALNAFVGYRCFYIAIPTLKQWPMKKLSNIMGVMWESDPNKSLWSLLAKAWSIIRDQVGKDRAPLDEFFGIMCPFLHIPPPEVYLEVCGWTLGSDKDGNPVVFKLPSQRRKALGAGIAAITLSVEDIINCCQFVGYAQGFVLDSENDSPTFLAQSGNTTNPPVTSQTELAAQTEPVVAAQTELAVPAYQSRLIARNDRRARRGTARDTGVAALLRQQVTDAYAAHGMHVAEPDDYFPVHDESVQFHDNLARVLANHDMDLAHQDISGEPCHLLAAGQAQQDIAGEPFDLLAADDPITTGWTDWGAFRLGADEDATLPNFDVPTL